MVEQIDDGRVWNQAGLDRGSLLDAVGHDIDDGIEMRSWAAVMESHRECISRAPSLCLPSTDLRHATCDMRRATCRSVGYFWFDSPSVLLVPSRVPRPGEAVRHVGIFSFWIPRRRE